MNPSAPLIALTDHRTAPEPWILLNQANDVLYWRSRNSDEIWCGLGCVFQSQSLGTCQEALSEIDTTNSLPFYPRCFGLIAFDPSLPLPQIWEGFSRQQFWIPEILVRYKGTQADSIVLTRGDSTKQPRNFASSQIALPAPVQSLCEQSNLSPDEWRKAVHSIQSQIQSSDLQKAVLSRQMRLEGDRPFRASNVLNRLASASTDSYLFACRKPGSGVFFGASPECLFHLENHSLAVDSLAGSRPRIKDHQTDRQLSEELVLSEKDLLEQRYVTDYIRDKLTSLCTNLHISETRVKSFTTVQHLYSEISGTINDSISAEAILTQLHPTPAICGVPTESARQLIGELEKDPRGLYAGAIGYTDLESTEFAVSIRSGLMKGDHAHLFAGAGIVADSEADNEYNECEWKFAGLRQAIFPKQ